MIDTKSIVINLNGFAAEETEEISRCLATLYSIREGEQPLDREFGLKNDFLDKPGNIARNLFALEVIEKTRKYMPEAEVENVTYEFDGEGQMQPIIYVKKGRAAQ